MNNWLPINTAPKDRRILLAYSDRQIFFGKYGSFHYEATTGERFGFVPENNSRHLYSIQPIAWQELPVFDGVIDG